jgi:DNA-directed RNA polymerase alpha subunit
VYASDIQSKDPKCVPVYPEMIIARLLAKQKIELQATAILGTGRKHAKWSPGLVWYTYTPSLKINQNSPKLNEFREKYPPQIFDKSGKIQKDSIIALGLVDAVDGVCDDIITVDYDTSSFIFTIESWGQLSCKEMVENAADILLNKCEEMEKLI